MFIVVNKMWDNYIWYVCELAIYPNPNSDWVLQPTETQRRERAMPFCKGKAERIAEILSYQIDEEGYSNKWTVEEF